MKFYICKTCGKIIAIVKDAPAPTMCCGQKMEEIVPGTTDAAGTTSSGSPLRLPAAISAKHCLLPTNRKPVSRFAKTKK